MKAPLLLTLLTGLLLAGAADGLSGLQARFESKLGHVEILGIKGTSTQKAKDHVSHQQVSQSRMGSEAAAVEEESQQSMQMHRSVEPEVALVQQFFKPTGSDYTTLMLHGSAGERYAIDIYDISGQKVLHREGILAEGDSAIRLNFTYAADGIYLVRAKAGERIESVRYLKQKVG